MRKKGLQFKLNIYLTCTSLNIYCILQNLTPPTVMNLCLYTYRRTEVMNLCLYTYRRTEVINLCLYTYRRTEDQRMTDYKGRCHQRCHTPHSNHRCQLEQRENISIFFNFILFISTVFMNENIAVKLQKRGKGQLFHATPKTHQPPVTNKCTLP